MLKSVDERPLMFVFIGIDSAGALPMFTQSAQEANSEVYGWCQVARVRWLRALRVRCLTAHRLPARLAPRPYLRLALGAAPVARTRPRPSPDPHWDEEFVFE